MPGLDPTSLTPVRSGGWAALLVISLGLQGCAGPQPPAPAAPVPEARPAPAGPLASPPLERERRWLQSWFEGTPVAIVQRGDGSVEVDVPVRHCFDSGAANVRPALAAVLDKVAQSLQRNPGAALTLLAAPGDAAADAELALRRAGQVRQHLRSRGVPAARLGAPSQASAAAVQLRLALTGR